MSHESDPVTSGEHVLQCTEVWGGNQLVEASVRMSGLDAWVYCKPYAQATGGGDVYYVSSCVTGRITRLLVADVSGHGDTVSVLAGDLRTLMRQHVNHLDQVTFVRRMNDQLVLRAKAGTFATAVVTTFFAPTGDLAVCNAGHPPPLIYRAREKAWRFMEAEEVHQAAPVVAPAEANDLLFSRPARGARVGAPRSLHPEEPQDPETQRKESNDAIAHNRSTAFSSLRLRVSGFFGIGAAPRTERRPETRPASGAAKSETASTSAARDSETRLSELSPANIPLGIVDMTDYEQFRVALEPGDLVICYTDCLPEARRPDGSQLGQDGLLALAQAIDRSDVHAIIPTLVARVTAWAGRPLDDDDVTLLLFSPNPDTAAVGLGRRLLSPARMIGHLASDLAHGRRPRMPDFHLANFGGAVFTLLERTWTCRVKRH